MLGWRIGLAVTGLGVLLFGGFELVGHATGRELLLLAIWSAAAVVLHDGLLSPVVLTVGWLLRRFVPDRARRYSQACLIAGGMVAVVALPLMLREGTQPQSKALLQRPYGAHLLLLLGLIAAVGLIGYGIRTIRDRSPEEPPAAAEPARPGAAGPE